MVSFFRVKVKTTMTHSVEQSAKDPEKVVSGSGDGVENTCGSDQTNDTRRADKPRKTVKTMI